MNARDLMMGAWRKAEIGVKRRYLIRRGLPWNGTEAQLDKEFRAHVERLLDGVAE